MKKILAIASLALSMPALASGAEFQTPGAVGMGGAGVARSNGSLTSYWNPAGGAFNDPSFAMHIGAGVGLRGSDGLAENVDRFSNINFDRVKNFNTATATAANVGEFVKTLSILNDIETRQGNMNVTVVAPVSFSVSRFSFGVFGNLEGNIKPATDIINILPTTTAAGSPALTVANLSSALGSTSYTPSGYLTTAQLATLQAQINVTLNDAAKSQQLAYAIDNQLKNSGISASTVLSTMTDIALPTLASGGTTTLNKNTSSVLTKALQYIEVPVSYGHPLNVGSKGKLGLGVTGKLISGTVYQNQVLLVNRANSDNVNAKDLIKDITNNKSTATAFALDLGALYKYSDSFSLGIVGKNLNSPKFNAPDYYKPVYNAVSNKVELTNKVAGTAVTIKPQVRSGIAIEPASWISIAADMDLTENDTVAPGTVVGSSYKSRNLGGGVELRAASWLKVRGGAYKNLSDTRGNVLTAGFKLLVLNVDGAFATDRFVINGNKLPREVQVYASTGFSF
jgi:hypothetical protein